MLHKVGDRESIAPLNMSLQLIDRLPSGDLRAVVRFKAIPELSADSQRPLKLDRRVRRDRSLRLHDLVDRLERSAHPAGQLSLGHGSLFERLQQHISGRDAPVRLPVLRLTCRGSQESPPS